MTEYNVQDLETWLEHRSTSKGLLKVRWFAAGCNNSAAEGAQSSAEIPVDDWGASLKIATL